MKKYKLLFAIPVAAIALAGCNDLDQLPYGNVLTADQKADIVENDPEMASATVNTLPQLTSSFMSLGYDNLHTDFGWPSIMIVTDSRGMDMPSALIGYNWYTAALEWSDFGGLYYDNLIYWRTLYNLIKTSNSVAAMVDPAATTGQLQYYRGQALGMRAWAYLNLAQMYQFTYAANPQAPTVPVLTEKNMDQAAAEGLARATGVEIYAQIKADLTEAIALLDKAAEQGVTRVTEAPSANYTKTFINSTVAYGLRARANLLTNDWDAAASDAQTCIDLAKKEGLDIAKSEDISVPSFYDINEKNWIWGFYCDPQSNLVGIVGRGGQFGSFYDNYPSAGVYRLINKALYESIPSDDVRKGWWLDGKATPPRTLPSQYREWISGAVSKGMQPHPAYTQIKFGAYENTPGTSTMSEDTPYMRVEEMYLILAEAQGMKDFGTGKTTLETFVRTRQPKYTCKATNSEELRDAIWFQRRIELWGEGFSYHDMMRLQKPCDRRGGGFDKAVVFNVAPGDPAMIFEIVQSEAQNNPLVGNVSNGAVVPTAVPDI